MHVEHDPGRVADGEDDHDAQEDGRQVHLPGLLLVAPAGALVRHPDAAEDVPVEEDEGGHGGQAGRQQAGPVDVEADVVGVLAQAGHAHAKDLERGGRKGRSLSEIKKFAANCCCC